jgi:rare lipoprotein A
VTARNILFVVPALLLAACGGGAPVPLVKDGLPSDVPQNLDAIPDATPREEARSASVNPPSYEVDGLRYYVLKTGLGYRERGLASWYGTKFHGKHTSTGETYDMFAMTAAHKTLPIPCYVRVTNVATGKQVVVRVNDRGPFHSGRIIDLSYAAATRLGIVKNGSALVEVETVTPGAAQPVKAAFLEVGNYDDPIQAVAVREQVSDLGITAVEIRTDDRSQVAGYRVLAGPFTETGAFDEARRRLEANQLPAKPLP